MSEAGLSFDTAMSRIRLLGVGECAAAALTRAVTVDRLAINVEVRAGVAIMLVGFSVVMLGFGGVVCWL